MRRLSYQCLLVFFYMKRLWHNIFTRYFFAKPISRRGFFAAFHAIRLIFIVPITILNAIKRPVSINRTVEASAGKIKI